MCVERVEQGTQDTTLWGSYVQGDGVWGELADFHHLRSAGEEILNLFLWPVANALGKPVINGYMLKLQVHYEVYECDTDFIQTESYILDTILSVSPTKTLQAKLD